MPSRFTCLILLLVLLLPTAPALAHEVRPGYLEMREVQPREFQVLWKTPMRGDLRLALAPVFSGGAIIVGPVTTTRTGDAAVQTWRLRFTAPLPGQTLRVDGLETTMTDVLARVRFADGREWTARLTPGAPAAEIPAGQGAMAVLRVYGALGVEHILLGADHLLFVAGLLLLTRGRWRIVGALTAFTVAHSITLGLAVLGLVQVPGPPVEAAIALSIAFVAAEVLRARQGHPSMAIRAPWLVAFLFGLLHGLGFAGALTDIGLPADRVPLALLGFNLGVEAGQLLFVGAVLAAVTLGRHLLPGVGPARPAAARAAAWRWPPYLLGTIGMFWVIQRVAAF